MDAAELIKKARASSGLSQVQLAERAGTSQSAIAAYEAGAKSPSVRTLDKLIRATGLTMTVRVNKAPPAHGELLNFTRSHQGELRSAAMRRRIRNLRVFGSTARGEENDQSDIDLLVDFDADKLGAAPLAGFKREAQAILGRTVDVSTPEMLNETVRRTVLAEAVPL